MELMIFLAGAIIGGCVSMIIFALLTVSKDEREDIENEQIDR